MKKLISLLIITLAFLGFAFFEATRTSSSNAAVAAYYKQVQALHILVPNERQANDVRAEIMAGENQQAIFSNFMRAARKYSTCPSGSSGGILGWFGRGDMVPAFEQAAFDLTPGQVSEPVKTQFGYHLIYVISRK